MGTMAELLETQRTMQLLAQYHERVRDAKGNDHLETIHNKYASECYNAAIAIGEYVSKLEEH